MLFTRAGAAFKYLFMTMQVEIEYCMILLELHCLVYGYRDCRSLYFQAIRYVSLVTVVLVVIGDVFSKQITQIH